MISEQRPGHVAYTNTLHPGSVLLTHFEIETIRYAHGRRMISKSEGSYSCHAMPKMIRYGSVPVANGYKVTHVRPIIL